MGIEKQVSQQWGTVCLFWDNLTKRERQALNILKNRTDIVVKQADKGGALVILDSKRLL